MDDPTIAPRPENYDPTIEEIMPTRQYSTRSVTIIGVTTIVILLLVLASAVLGYRYLQLQATLKVSASPTPVPEVTVPGLKTYTDPQNRFQFQYPSAMIEETSSADGVFYLTSPDYVSPAKAGYRLQVSVISKDIPSLASYQKVVPNTPDASNIDQNELVTTGNLLMAMKTYKDTWSIYKDYYVYSKDVGVIFHGTGIDHSVIDGLVGTFTFLPSTSKAGADNLYSNALLGYSFMVPPGMPVQETIDGANIAVDESFSIQRITTSVKTWMSAQNGGRNKYTPTTVNGLPALVTHVKTDAAAQDSYVVTKGDESVVIYVTPDNADAQKMLNSFTWN